MLIHPYTLLAAGALLLASIYYLLFVPPAKLYSNFNSVPVIKSRFPGLGAVGFFANRYTFLSRSTTTDPRHPHHGIYKFSLLGKVVYHVGSTSESVMRSITTNKDLSFSGGNNFLFAGIAGAGQKGGDAQGKIDAEERKEMMAIAKAISPQRLALMRSALTHDALEAYEGWLNGGESALVDLQKGYYPLIFRFTVRLMGMAEYASQPATLAKLQTGFWQTQRNSGYWTTLLPWIPQPRLLTRLWGALTLWKMVRTDVRKRIKEERKEEDFAQNLIDARDMGVDKIARWVIGALLAGILNTIGTGAYTIAFLGASPELRAACREEVERTLRASAEARGDEYEELSLHERLARVELSEWEEGFELLHLCFKEAIRLLLTNSLNRYYPGPSKGSPRLVIDGHPIEDDVYVTFSPPSNLHDADSFSNPFHFDPYRYQRGEGSTDYSYIAWGAGRHKCTGMRFAKLETIVALATLLTYSDDFTTVDERGEVYGLDNVPLPDLSQSHWREPTRYMRVRVERKKGAEKKGSVF